MSIPAKLQRYKFNKFKPVIWLIPFILFFYLFQIAPMLWVFINSFLYEGTWTLENYQEIFDSAFILQGFHNSLWIAFWSSVRGIIEDFNLYSSWGLLTLYVYFQIPLGALLLYPAFDALKKDAYEAAALLGASPFRYWVKIGLPILSPALLGTFIILFANAIGAYASVYALTAGNYNMVTIRIASLVSGDLFLEPNLAAAISVLLMLLLAFITAINQWLISRSYHT